MAMRSYFEDPPQAQGNWWNNLSKFTILFQKWLDGDYSPTISTGGMTIPENDEQVFSYYFATDNISTIVYKKDGAVVATQVFEYVGGGVADGDRISRITLS